MPPKLTLLSSPAWTDYELLDSGNGRKLERFGSHVFIRPEHQAIWNDRVCQRRNGKHLKRNLKPGEAMKWGEAGSLANLLHPGKCNIRVYGFKPNWVVRGHVGVFPEQAAQWDWMANLIYMRTGLCPC